MKQRMILIAVMLVSIMAAGLLAEKTADTKDKAGIKIAKAPVGHDVDLVICLDTSGSMRGLIESAKQKLWTIVNDLATAKPKPRLRVGLYHYGNDGLNRENGWVERLCPLTDNLDLVYEKLFKLRTNGGTEYVARVVRAATMEMKWSSQKKALKMIVVAGNEPATQDNTYKLRDICKETISKGIIINTIFCGPVNTGKKSGWADAADWADGQYAAIDQNHGTVAIATPHDKKMLKLNDDLNKTYVGYGKKGKEGLARQISNDANAKKCKLSTAAERVGGKTSGLYNNSVWDLVDGVKDKTVDLKKLPASALPENMRKMTVKQRKEFIATLAKRRTELHKEIQKLQRKRTQFQKKEMKRRGLDDSKSFDANLRKAIRLQGSKKGMKFKKK